jgi:hypothetical protein
MKIAIRVSRGLVGITGAIQLVLGVLFWTGHARDLVNFHMINGMIFVLALWTVAGLSARAGAPLGLVATTLVWGLVLPALGMTQSHILVGPSHWVIQVAHLLTAFVAMGLAGALQARARGVARSDPRPHGAMAPSHGGKA